MPRAAKGDSRKDSHEIYNIIDDFVKDEKEAMAMRWLIKSTAINHHEYWKDWMQYFFSVTHHNQDGSVVVPYEYVKKWLRRMSLDYQELRPKEKSYNLDMLKKHFMNIFKFAVASDELKKDKNGVIRCVSCKKNGFKVATLECDVCGYGVLKERKQIMQDMKEKLGMTFREIAIETGYSQSQAAKSYYEKKVMNRASLKFIERMQDLAYKKFNR